MQHTPKPKHGRCAVHRPIDATHDFDPASGHCIHGCGNCDDGRIINMLTGATVIAGRSPTHEQPAEIQPNTLDWNHA